MGESMMNVFEFENSEAVDVNGTSLMGTVKTDYATLVEKFGEPTYTSFGDKVTAEWTLEFAVDADNGSLGEDGNIDYVTATIYDWKELETPMGEYNWHIGGYSFESVEAVESALEKPMVGLS